MNRLLPVYVLFFLFGNTYAQIQKVEILSPVSSGFLATGIQFEKIEMGIQIAETLDNAVKNGKLNPYNPEEVDLSVLIYDDSLRFLRRGYGFYMEEFQVDADGQALKQVASSRFPWRLRLSFEQAGNYKLVVQLYTRETGISTFQDTLRISVRSGDQKGPLLRVTGKSYLQYSTGAPFFGISETLPPFNNENANHYDETGINHEAPYYPSNVVRSMKEIIRDFAVNGGNYLKYYFMPNSIDLEWDSLGYYGSCQNRAHDLDQIFAEIERQGVYLQLGVWTWEQFNSNWVKGYFGWENHPYRKIPGVINPEDLFKSRNACEPNRPALEYMKRKIRYVLARWGYSSNFATLELMTEMDQLGTLPDSWNFQCNKRPSTFENEAYASLAAYAKSIQPRIFTGAGVANFQSGNADLFKSPQIDFSDYHYYTDVQNIGNFHAYISQYLALRNGKPFHCGEYGFRGIGSDACWYNAFGTDPDPKTDFRNTLWSSSFSGAFTSAMYFWTYGYVHSKRWGGTGYKAFRPLAAFFEGEDLNRYPFQPVRNACNEKSITCNNLVSPPDCQTTQKIRFKSSKYVKRYDPSANPGIETSDEDSLEVFALYHPQRMLGWVHNKTNWWYNLPHFVDPNCPAIKNYIHPTAAGEYPFQQKETYASDMKRQTLVLKGLLPSMEYRISWYTTQGNGGPLPTYDANVASNAEGRAIVEIPPLLYKRSITDEFAADYGFKLSLISDVQVLSEGIKLRKKIRKLIITDI